MRQKVITQISNDILIIKDFETGDVLYQVKVDKFIRVANLNFWFRQFENGEYGLVRHTKKGSQTIYLEEKESIYMMATSAQAAEHKLFGFEKKGPVGDILSKTLEKLGFCEQCIKNWDDEFLYGYKLYVKPGYIEGCPNYESGDKNIYSYELFSDSTQYVVTDKNAATCEQCKNNILRKNGTVPCKRENVTKRVSFKDGTYAFIVRTNLQTNKKIVKSIVISNGCNREKLAQHLESFLESIQ